MKIILKLSLLIFLALIVIASSGCQGKSAPYSLKSNEKQLKSLNKEKSGVGVPYNYDGPNTNKPLDPQD